ncbi:MAG: helicase [Alteromonadaceae bacterium]|nr:MAG: helicase [Alteromonadaceae bacterium]
MSENPKLQLAHDYVCQTENHIFLTGKAGTGKTTFLHSLQDLPPKRMIVAAPTGVAAINARGETLHAFFQLPFGPYIPGAEAVQRRFRREKINIIKSLELLVIDEISMVRADMLDAVDFVLRRYRQNDLPFGGVQLLMIGDVHQLAPVVKRDEEAILRAHYQSFYFFGSRALQQAGYVSVELDHIYRQSDPHFIRLLNKVRNNQLNEQDLAQLNQRCHPEVPDAQGKLPITLSSHNRTADAINVQQLDNLSGRAPCFEAEITGDYPASQYPMAASLSLKVGAQVMFTRNDSSGDKRYFNGKIGRVTQVSNDHIKVHSPGDEGPLHVGKEVWENVKYTVNPESKAIEGEIVGTFTQCPLALAWAITIHKSQGLTFDSIIIDAGAAFAHGQIYVALSRCKTLQGITLRSPLPISAIKTDVQVAQFSENVQRHPPDQAQLLRDKIHYQQKLLLQCFDFQPLWQALNYFVDQCQQHEQRLTIHSEVALDALCDRTYHQLISVGDSFQKQLQAHFSVQVPPENNDYIQERCQKAYLYFTAKFPLVLIDCLLNFGWSCDNQELNKTLDKALQALQEQVMKIRVGIDSCQQGFAAQRYLQSHSESQLSAAQTKQRKKEKGKENGEAIYAQLEHPKLFQHLKAWRDTTADELELPRYAVLHQRILFACAEALPQNKKSLLKIHGIGKGTMKKYGEALLGIVSDYCKQQGIDVEEDLKSEPEPESESETSKAPSKKENTKLITYTLFREGKVINEIAKIRGLKPTTIENHLAYFIKNGEIDLTELVDNTLIARIRTMFKRHQTQELKVIKEALGDDVSYGQIRMVAASQPLPEAD